MWRSTARSLLSRFPRQRFLLSPTHSLHLKTLVFPRSLPAAQSHLARFLSVNPDVGSTILDDTTVHLGKDSSSSDATAKNSFFSEDSTSSSEKDSGISEEDDGCEDAGGFAPEEGEAEDVGEIVEVDAEKLDEVLSVLRVVEPELVHSSLDELDLVPSEEFAVRILTHRDLPVDNLIEFLTWAHKRPDIVKNSAVVDLFVTKVTGSPEISVGQASRLWDAISEVGEAEKGLLTVRILNILIETFSKLGRGKSAVAVYRGFDKFGCVPDGDTFYLTINPLGKPSCVSTAWDVCEEMVSSKQFPDSHKVGKIIKFFCKAGKAKDAHMVYLAAKESGKPLPSLYMDILIDHLSRRDETLNLAIDLLDAYEVTSEKMSVKPFACVISGLCRVKNTQRAKEFLERMLASGPRPVKAVFNDVITALSKAGEVEDAVSLLKTMKIKGFKPDIRAYNVIMSAFARAGLIDEARDIFYKAKRVHRKLGRVSYHILSRGYCRIDDYENAIKYMHGMKEEGIFPNVDDYKKMIQSLCLKALDWRTAQTLLDEMKASGLYLDGQTRALVYAVKELEEEEIQSVGEVEES